MIKQYPHTAIITTVGSSTTLPNGDIIPGAEITSSFKCRLEPASKGGYVKGVDGTQVSYSWTIYCKSAILSTGAEIEVQDDAGRTLCLDTVKQFSQGQLNSRIWL